MKPITNTEDVIDSRDVIERIEALEAERDQWAANRSKQPEAWTHEDSEELAALKALHEDCEDYIPDWNFGATLVRDSYFKDYAQEFAEDIGAVRHDAEWPGTCIDWEQAAEELQQDYSLVDFDGVDYWIR